MNLYKLVFYFAKNPKAQQKLLQRREKRRLKETNTFAAEYTGERPVHIWLDPKRTRALAKIYEEQRNKHRFTIQLEKADKLKFKQLMDDYYEKAYYRRLQEKYWLKQHSELLRVCEEEVNNLPYLLRNEMSKILTHEERLEIIKQNGDPYIRYEEQILRLLPEEEANNLLLARRLGKIATDSLTQGE